MNQNNNQSDRRQLSSGEELLNSITHGLGALLSFVAMVILILIAKEKNDSYYLISFSVYGLALVLLYLSSTLYHSFSNPKLKNLFARFDHVSIFLLIAGTYTPILLISLRGTMGWILFGIIWSIAIAGAVVRSIYLNRFRKLMVAIYLIMGWLFVFAGNQVFDKLSATSIWFLALGGIAYSVGVIFYLWRSLPYSHGIWHLFVLAGSILHFFAIYHISS